MSDLSDLSIMSSSETLVPSSSSAGPSRKRAIDEEPVKVKKRKSEGDAETSYCHHCRQPCLPSDVIRCSHFRSGGKNGSTKKCALAWCTKDLNRRYNIDAGPLLNSGVNFTCPCCLGQCQTASYPGRKKRGLEPLGRVINGSSPAAPKTVVVPKSPATPKAVKAKTSTPNVISTKPIGAPTAVDRVAIFGRDSDSELSSLSDDNAVVGDSSTFDVPTPSRATSGKQKATKPPVKRKPKVSSGSEPSKPKKKSVTHTAGSKMKIKSGANGEPKEKKKRKPKSELVDGEAKGKAKKAAKGESKTTSDKPKPIRKPEVPPEPPVFEKVDTRLSYEEAQQRIALREYLWRFRSVIAIPERSLPPVDDFDRALSEASVRLFAGAMLEVIREEVEMYGDEELVETLRHHREELRYYADLARFNTIYANLEEPLDLQLPRSTAHDDLDPVELDVSSRRAGASRLPSPAQVVRMLLAFAERTLSTPIIRSDLDSQTEENAMRRQHLSATKRENTAWDIKKKKLEEARGKSKSAADTKLTKQTLSTELHEHRLRLAQLNVNLAADLSRRAPRHEPLGLDRDGRVYYVLSPRPVLDDGRPPTGWASGLLVYGQGVVGSPSPDDDLPVTAYRWSHFGKSKSVRQLIKWIEWNWKKSITATKTKTTKAKRAQQVIPTSKGRARSSSSSELSTLSEDTLLELYDPRGYEPSAEALDEQSKEFVRRLKEVAEWLEVLEWKGMGEVH